MSQAFAIDEHVEAYWPETKEWLPAIVLSMHAGGSLLVEWASDASESKLPYEYVRKLTTSRSRAVPSRAEPRRAVPSRAEPHRAVPSRAEPSRAVPSRTEPHRAVLSRTEPHRVAPSRAEPHRAAPRRTSRSKSPQNMCARARHCSRSPENMPARGRLERHRGAVRDTRPAWMTKGVGIGTKMLGEATGELLKPGLTRQALETLEKEGVRDLGKDPFGMIFRESAGGSSAISKLESAGPSGRGPADGEQADDDSAHDVGPPCFESLEELSFNGAAEAAVDIPHACAQNPPGSFSVDFWARSWGGAGYRSPLSSRDCPPPRGYAFFITPQGQWAFWVGMPRCNEWLKISGPEARTGKWHRLTGTFCGRSQTVRFCVDGVEVGSRRAQSAFEPNPRRPLRLGAGASEVDRTLAKFPFSGDVRDVRVYDAALRPPLPEAVSADGFDDGPPSKRRR